MVSVTPKYLGWESGTKIVLLFSLVFLCFFLTSVNRVSASTTEITVIVSPVREVVVNSQYQVIEIYSNTSVNVKPIVHVGSISGRIVSANSVVSSNYNDLLNKTDFNNRYGLVYKKSIGGYRLFSIISVMFNLTKSHIL